MPNTREKLIELLDKAFLESDSNYGMPSTSQVSDHLIANGVTIPVRCGECKFTEDRTEDGWLWCGKWCDGSNVDGYCHKGERKEL